MTWSSASVLQENQVYRKLLRRLIHCMKVRTYNKTTTKLCHSEEWWVSSLYWKSCLSYRPEKIWPMPKRNGKLSNSELKSHSWESLSNSSTKDWGFNKVSSLVHQTPTKCQRIDQNAERCRHWQIEHRGRWALQEVVRDFTEGMWPAAWSYFLRHNPPGKQERVYPTARDKVAGGNKVLPP